MCPVGYVVEMVENHMRDIAQVVELLLETIHVMHAEGNNDKRNHKTWG